MARTSQNHAGGNGSRCNAMSNASRASSARPARASHQARAYAIWTSVGSRDRTIEVRARQIPFSKMRQDEAHRHMAPGFGGVERQCLLGAAHGLLLAAHQQVSPISTELGVRSKSVCLRVATVELGRAGKEGIGLGVLVMMKLFSPLQEIVSSNLTSASTNPADRTSLLPGFLFIAGAATPLAAEQAASGCIIGFGLNRGMLAVA